MGTIEYRVTLIDRVAEEHGRTVLLGSFGTEAHAVHAQAMMHGMYAGQFPESWKRGDITFEVDAREYPEEKWTGLAEFKDDGRTAALAELAHHNRPVTDSPEYLSRASITPDENGPGGSPFRFRGAEPVWPDYQD